MVKYDRYYSNFDPIATNKKIIFINWNQKTSVQAHYACQINQTKKKNNNEEKNSVEEKKYPEKTQFKTNWIMTWCVH